MKEKERNKMSDAIKRVVNDMLDKNVPIINADKVVKATREKENIMVTIHQVKTVMKDEMGLGYRLAKKVPV